MRIVEILQHLNQQNKIDEVENAEIINYHLSCLAENEHQLSVASKGVKLESLHDKILSEAYMKIKENVIATVIDKREVRALADIHQVYAAFFEEGNSNSQVMNRPLGSHGLLNKLLRDLPVLTKTVYGKPLRTFVHLSDLSFEEIFTTGYGEKLDLISQIKRVAFEIRKKVKENEKHELPKRNLTPLDIIEGECVIPEELTVLMECIMKGPRSLNSSSKDIKVQSICSSIIYTMTDGSVKPSMSLLAGLALKTLTGSRKVINVMSRMGFCPNYSLIAAIETELAYGNNQKKQLLPYGLVPNPHLNTNVAFDNYDRFVETCSGKDTLHDTVGIVIQNECPEANTIANDAGTSRGGEIDTVDDTGGRRRKYYSNFDSSIDVYARRNQNVVIPVLGMGMETGWEVPENWQAAMNSNHVWLLHHVFNTNCKRWFTYHSERCLDRNPQQLIGYLPNLNASPTSDSVVLKTLQMAQEIAMECHQQNIVVTYDLAIASKAWKIQADMSPNFDNIFINLGAFHIQMSMFKVCIQWNIQLNKVIKEKLLEKLL